MTKELAVVIRNNCHLTFESLMKILIHKKIFLGFYETRNLESYTIVAAITLIILRFNISFEFCYG